MIKLVSFNTIKSLFNPRLFDSLIYYLICLWMMIKLVNFTAIYNFYPSSYFLLIKISRVLCFCFVLFYIYKWNDILKNKCNLLFCFIFLLVSYFFNKYTKTQLVFDLFFIPLFLCQFLNREKFYKYILLSFCLFIIFLMCLYFSGFILDSEVFVRQNGIKRYSFGFAHPNSLGFYIVLFCLLYALLKTTYKLYDYLIFIALAFFCYKVPNSITSSTSISLLVFFIFLSNCFLRKKTSTKINLVILFISLLLVASVLFFTYYITFTETFKTYLQSLPGSIWARFELSKKGYEIFGFSLLGKYDEFRAMIVDIIQHHGRKAVWLILDCTYFFLPIIHGLIVYVIFLLMLIWSLVRGILAQKYLYALIIIGIVIYGVSETTIFSPVMMPLFAYTFFSTFKNNDKSKD